MDDDRIERLRERLLLCPICMDEFQDPRLLPCHHTICCECIQNILINSATAGRVFRCPQCRHDVCVPRGGASELPVNFFVRSLQDELGVEEKSGPCQLCQRSFVLSQFRCIDCDLDICRFCIHEHRLVQHKESGKVNILRMEIGVSGIGDSIFAGRNCKIHTEELVQLFCMSCQHPVCVSCSCGEHRKHEVVPLMKKLNDARTILQQKLENLTSERRSVRAWLRQLEGAEIEARDNAKRTLKDVEYRALELHRVIDNLAETAKTQVKQELQEQLSGLASCKGRFNLVDQRLDLGVGFLKSLQETDINLELLDAYGKFSSELDQLRKDALATAVIPITNQRFLAGHHLTSRGYLVSSFGTLLSNRMVLCVGRASVPFAWKLRKLTRDLKLAPSIFILAMVYTLLNLLFACYSMPTDYESMLAFLLTLYLVIAACFAYCKP